MSTREELMAFGLPADLARGLGTSALVNVVPAGNNQATAAQIAAPCVVLTTAAAGGAILGNASGKALHFILNNSGNAQTVYAAGSETINVTIAGATGMSIGNGKVGMFVPVGSGWLYFLTG